MSELDNLFNQYVSGGKAENKPTRAEFKPLILDDDTQDIDANKKEYISYFNLIDKMITKNGIILADNILSHYEKVQDYVENLFDDKNYQSQILNLGTGMMLSRRNDG